MEEMYSLDQLSDACRLMRLDPNYSPSNRFNDNDDDPLGCPEITVKINDDWTVSSDEKHFDTSQYEPDEDTDENEDEDEDEDKDDVQTEVYTLDDKVIDSFISDMVSRSQKEASSDEDEQIVPSSPKIRKLSLGENQLTFPIKSVVAEAVRKFEKDIAEVRGIRKDDQKKKDSDVETRKRSDVQNEIGDRSKPQPP